MEKEKCEICDKIIDGDSVRVSQKKLEEIGYEIPATHIQGEILMNDIFEKVEEKVKGKVFIVVGGSPCHCYKKIKIALKRIKQ
jgi:site-specific DNA-cytosine methylase